jgi:serine/threonine protein kinase
MSASMPVDDERDSGSPETERPPRVFICYSHDSELHRRRVLALAQRLRGDGIDAWLDAYDEAPAQGWPRWLAEQVNDADFIVIVCTVSFRRGFEGEPMPGARDVNFAGQLATSLLHEQKLDFERVAPVLFDETRDDAIPLAIRAATAHVLMRDYEALRRRLMRQRAIVPHPLGAGGPKSAEERLATLEAERRRRQLTGEEPHEVVQEILALRRQLRDGPPLERGDILAERYELEEQIGRGGFAKVWKAYDRVGKQAVAVKLLRGDYVDDRSVVERFRGGALLLKRLHHSAVVPVIDGPLQDGRQHFFVMPWFVGGDLRQAVQGHTIDRATALEAVARALEGIEYTHQANLVHRDVKPSNILLDEAGLGWIADFDLVRDAETTRGTRTQAGIGTVNYAAPEQLHDAKNVDARADVYAAAMSVLYVLAGKDPPLMVMKTAPEYVDGINCPESLKRALRGALAYRADDRKTTCLELVAAIRGKWNDDVDQPVHPDPDREVSAEELASAWRTLTDAGFVISFNLPPDSAQSRLRWAVTRLKTNAQLTQWEADVLALVLQGRNNGEIGKELEISRPIVKWHLHNIFVKTGTSNREGLLREALRLGGVTPQPSTPAQIAEPDLNGDAEIEEGAIEGREGEVTEVSSDPVVDITGDEQVHVREARAWVTGAELAKRFAAPRGVVRQVIELLGLSESRINTKVRDDGEIMYSSAAAGLIGRELQSRGYEQTNALREHMAELRRRLESTRATEHIAAILYEAEEHRVEFENSSSGELARKVAQHQAEFEDSAVGEFVREAKRQYMKFENSEVLREARRQQTEFENSEVLREARRRQAEFENSEVLREARRRQVEFENSELGRTVGEMAREMALQRSIAISGRGEMVVFQAEYLLLEFENSPAGKEVVRAARDSSELLSILSPLQTALLARDEPEVSQSTEALLQGVKHVTKADASDADADSDASVSETTTLAKSFVAIVRALRRPEGGLDPVFYSLALAGSSMLPMTWRLLFFIVLAVSYGHDRWANGKKN